MDLQAWKATFDASLSGSATGETRVKQHGVYKSYLLVLLMVILAFNFVDRMALGIVLQDIKIDLGLSDTQLGLLSGIAFALFYSLMGIPIARWADRGNRVVIISLSAAIWSVMVSLCGLAGSFIQLLLIRIGVGVGEAGCIPPAHSLIADNFTRAERPRAAAIYAFGGPLGFVLGYLLAGWLNEFYGWRLTFILLGVPGVLLAALAWFTLEEPRRSPPDFKQSELAASVQRCAQPSLKEVCVTLWSSATFRHLLFGFAIVFFFGYGVTLWLPTFFVRSYGMRSGEIGNWLALIFGLGGLGGTYLSGVLASRYAAHNERLQLKGIAFAKLGYGVLILLAYLSPNKYLAFALFLAANVCGYALYGPLFATIQTLLPERMRAVSIAILYLFGNLIGMGLGPLATGMLSDAFQLWAGAESLRYSLIALTPGFFWAAWHLWRASQTVMGELANSPSIPRATDPSGAGQTFDAV